MFSKWNKKYIIFFVLGLIVLAGVFKYVSTKPEVKFDRDYAEAGKELVAVADGVKNVKYEWSVGGEVIENDTNSYTPTEEDLEKWIEVTVKSWGKKASAKMYFSKLPVVYIDTNGAAIDSKEEYVEATMAIQGNSLYDAGATTLYDGAIEIRGRGNTTWEKPKKPYRIKLDEKTDVFGMGESKHWVLLANYLDESLMRNTLSYDLSGALGMEQMSTVWVDVVLNGEYVGNYQFCEQVRVDETRVDVFDWEGFAEDSAAIIAEAEGLEEDDLADCMNENMEWITSGQVEFEEKTYNIADYEEIEIPSINGGYLLEIDEYFDEVSKFKTTTAQPVMFKSPEFVATNTEMLTFVKDYVQAFEYAVYSPEHTAKYDGKEVHYSELFDVDALIDYLIVSEIFYNEDLNKKSTYLHKDIDGLMKMGPIWDMDWSSGAEGTSATAVNKWATLNFRTNAQAAQWYKGLVKDPYFLVKMQERYWEVRDGAIQEMLDSIDGYHEYLKESGNADTELWTKTITAYENGRAATFEKDAKNLKNWLNHHVSWIDKQMETEESLNTSFLYDNEGVIVEIADVTESDLRLNISTTQAGDIDIFVNSRKCDTIVNASGNVSCSIKAENLTAEDGKKNVIEVKVRDEIGTVIAKDYVTIK